MATQMPIEQDYKRYIDGISEPDEDGNIDVELPEDDSEVIEQADGSAIVVLDDFEGPMDDADFYQNLAEEFDPYDLNTIAMRYMDLVKNDKTSREERDKKYEEGLKRTGLGDRKSVV